MPADRIISAEPRDAMGNLTSDCSCRKCGYNLRGVNIARNCPECGTAVVFSLRGEMLRQSDPEWLRLLHRGAVIILITDGLWVLHDLLHRNYYMSYYDSAWATIIDYLLHATYIFSAIGIWMLTARDPSGTGEFNYGKFRTWARIGAIALVLDTIPWMLDDNYWLFHVSGAAIKIISFITTGVIYAGTVLRMLYLSRLCERIPNGRLRRHFLYLSWAFGVNAGLLILSGVALFMIFAGSTKGVPILKLLSLPSFFCFIPIPMAIKVAHIIVLNRLRKWLKHIAAEATYLINTPNRTRQN